MEKMTNEVLSVKDLVKRYDEKLALDHFCMTVNEGEVLGLLGPNGCGKTTAINCMLSLLRFGKGEINIFGKKMSPQALDIKQNIGLVPQDLAFFSEFTVRENIDYFCGLYVSDAKQRRQLVDEAIDFVGLKAYEKYMAKKLSGGLKRRLNIACGIAHKPKLIFMDEPTVAVDAQSRNFILNGVKQLAKNGATVIYTTHYLEEAEELCDRLVIMDEGKNLAEGSYDELKKMVRTYEKIIIEFVDAPENLGEKLNSIPHVLEVNLTQANNQNEYTILFEESINNLSELILFINNEKLAYTKLYSEQPSLNDVFLELTGKELRD